MDAVKCSSIVSVARFLTGYAKIIVCPISVYIKFVGLSLHA